MLDSCNRVPSKCKQVSDRQLILFVHASCCSILIYFCCIIIMIGSKLSKLPLFYRSNPTYLKIAEYFQKSTMNFSSLFIQNGNDLHIMLKDGSIHIPEDWEAYSILKAFSKMLVGTGQNMRQEFNYYGLRQAYGNKDIEELNNALLGEEKQKIFIFSKKMSLEELQSQISDKYYQIVTIGDYDSIYNAFQKVQALGHKPVTFQIGLNIVNQYFAEVAKGKRNYLDTFLVSKYSGEFQEKMLGRKLEIPLEKYYDLMWKSEDIPCKLSNNQKGVLNFEIHIAKNQGK